MGSPSPISKTLVAQAGLRPAAACGGLPVDAVYLDAGASAVSWRNAAGRECYRILVATNADADRRIFG